MTTLAEAPERTSSAFRIERDGDLATIWFDLPGEKVNKFSTAVMSEFAAVVDELENDRDIKRVIIASGKPSIFIAGADVTEFSKATSAEQAAEYTRFGQQTIHRFSKLPQVTVAAINGAALGGGCELAITCDYRVMSDSPRAQIGLPETKLGIFPAWGGTTKLPRLIGLAGALDIILNGKTLDSKRAKRAGLVDEVVPAAILLDIAKQFSTKPKRRGSGRTKFYVEGNPIARRVIFSKARKAVMAQTHGHYPAPLAAIEVMDYGMSAGVERKLARITSTTDWSGFERCNLVVEAVVENVDVKRQVLSEFEAIAGPNAIFATNTSTIPITDIAAQAKRPENVAGMHFFNPVDRMPLVEVIRGAKTSDLAMVTVANFARKLGKTVVYCNDGPGFVVNRILGPYMNESGFILEEGSSIESVDKAMLDFGMPMGPAALLDEVGIDVAAKVAKILGAAFGNRMQASRVVDTLFADGRHGKKNGKGLYLYEAGKRQGPDPSVYKLLNIRSTHAADATAVVERMIFAMVNEAAMI